MQPVITYSLRNSSPDSEEYYSIIKTFAAAWTDKIKDLAADILTSYHQYILSIGLPERSREEMASEFLVMGILLHEKRARQYSISPGSIKTQSFLVRIQDRWPALAGITKVLRGWVNGASSASYINLAAQDTDNLADVITLLESEGEGVKAKRLKQWQGYLNSCKDLVVQETIRLSLGLARDFAKSSLEVLGKYSQGVDQFLACEANKHRWQYDFQLVSRSRLQYHLGMVATEMLNQAFREHFSLTDHKIVVVPPCMCAPAKACQSIQTAFGAKCESCTPSCRVNQISKMGKKYGFDVFMIPDDIRAISTGNDRKKIGVVGVSCALTNWGGGWETSSLGISAQGLLLDYVGCKYHWDRHGFPTDTNLRQLISLVGVQQNN